MSLAKLKWREFFIFLLFLLVNCEVFAEVQAQGFFGEEVKDTGFFSEEQASIPIKNPNGNTTTRKNIDKASALGETQLIDTGFRIGRRKLQISVPTDPSSLSEEDSFDFQERKK